MSESFLLGKDFVNCTADGPPRTIILATNGAWGSVLFQDVGNPVFRSEGSVPQTRKSLLLDIVFEEPIYFRDVWQAHGQSLTRRNLNGKTAEFKISPDTEGMI